MEKHLRVKYAGNHLNDTQLWLVIGKLFMRVGRETIIVVFAVYGMKIYEKFEDRWN